MQWCHIILYGLPFLQNKLEALERKYELQAARHQLLTNELSMLRHQSSFHDDASSTTTNAYQHKLSAVSCWLEPLFRIIQSRCTQILVVFGW